MRYSGDVGGVWRSLVARSVRVGEVPSSNLGTPMCREALRARGAPRAFPAPAPAPRLVAWELRATRSSPASTRRSRSSASATTARSACRWTARPPRSSAWPSRSPRRSRRSRPPRTWGAQLLVVHHGLFWDGDSRAIGPVLRRRLEVLFAAGMTPGRLPPAARRAPDAGQQRRPRAGARRRGRGLVHERPRRRPGAARPPARALRGGATWRRGSRRPWAGPRSSSREAPAASSASGSARARPAARSARRRRSAWTPSSRASRRRTRARSRASSA